MSHTKAQFINKLNEFQEAVEFGEECGLTFTGEIEDGRPVFIGDNRSWDYFNNGGPY